MTKQEARDWLRGLQDARALSGQAAQTDTLAVTPAELCKAESFLRYHKNVMIEVDGQQGETGAWRSLTVYPMTDGVIDRANPIIEETETAEGVQVGLFIMMIIPWAAKRLREILPELP